MKIVLITLLVISNSFAAGSGSAMDLIPSFVNLGLLLGFLIWKLKPFLSDHFRVKSENVSELMTRAKSKAKEANEMMELHKGKIATADDEIKKMKSIAKKDIEIFRDEYSKEVNDRIERLKTEAKQRIGAEEKSISDSINELLVDKVIGQAKSKIKEDKGLNTTASQSMVKGL